jgi:hypothetical protein
MPFQGTPEPGDQASREAQRKAQAERDRQSREQEANEAKKKKNLAKL